MGDPQHSVGLGFLGWDGESAFPQFEGRRVDIAPDAPGLQQLADQRHNEVVPELIETQQLPHVGRVLLLNMGLIVLVAGPRAGHFHGFLPTGKVAVKAMQPPCWPRFQVAHTSVQPLKMSASVRLQRKLPPMSPPQWATVSASVQSGSLASQHSAHTGTRALIAALVFGVRRLTTPAWTFLGANTRSI